jgi:hypothetical protein
MKLIAIKKNGKYYCKENDKYLHVIPDESRLRFDVVRLPSFSEKWVVFNKLPTSAEKHISGRLRIIDYQLKDEFEVTDKTPSVLPPGSFDCIKRDEGDGDCIELGHQDIKGLYETNSVRDPDVWEPIEFEIDLVDEDCEPLVNPKYKFRTEFPYYIENHEVVRHKYPCFIKGIDVYQLIRDAVKENLPDHCVITSDYDFSFTVKVRTPVIHEETFRVDVSSFNARKPKMVNKPLRTIDVTVIDIQTEKRYSGIVIQSVHADNYKDLERKMDVLIQEYIDRLDWKPTVCPHCKGYGWIQVK